MKQSRNLPALIILIALGWLGVAQAESILLKAIPGSTVRLDGTSSVHDWTVEGKLIGGRVEIEGDFPVEPGQKAELGEVEVKLTAFIPITSLKSVKDGKPYSVKMDEIMHEKLGKPNHKSLTYQLDQLILKSVPDVVGDAYRFESKGRLIIGGVTNTLELPVAVTPMDGGKVKFATQTSVKMSDYQIDPPAPKIALGLIKTGDEVQVSIEWMTARVAPE